MVPNLLNVSLACSGVASGDLRKKVAACTIYFFFFRACPFTVDSISFFKHMGVGTSCLISACVDKAAVSLRCWQTSTLFLILQMYLAVSVC